MTNVNYTEAQNMSSYSEAIQTVAYDSVDGKLYVTWQSAPSKAYVYYATPEQGAKALKTDVSSVRANVKEVTDTLQRLFPVEGVSFYRRLTPPAPKNSYTVVLTAEGTFKVNVDAESFDEAARYIYGLFKENFTEGELEVVGVTKN